MMIRTGFLAVLLASWACVTYTEAPPPPSGLLGSGTSSGGSSHSPEKSPPPVDASTPPATADAGALDAAVDAVSLTGCEGKTGRACQVCCEDAAPTAVTDLLYQSFGECACESPGMCAFACASSYCAGNSPSGTCAACLDDVATACNAAAERACTTPACGPFLACISKCP